MEIEGKIFFPIRGIITTLLVGTVIALLFVYALYQARFLTEGPLITLHSEPPHTTSSSTLLIAGRAQNIVSLSLNGRAIYTTDQGDFSETLTLPMGYTVVTIEGVDRFKKHARLERNIVYTPITTQ